MLNDELYKQKLSELEFVNKTDLSLRNKYLLLKQILERSCKEITEGESLQFPSLFSRLVFIAQKLNLPRQLEWNLQTIRVRFNFLLRDEANLITENQYRKAYSTLLTFFEGLYKGEFEKQSEREDVDTTTIPLDRLRVQLLAIDEENELLVCTSDVLTDETLYVRYNVPKINEDFNETINRLWVGAQINLLNNKVDEDGYYIPRFFVLEPDYLVDASAIAECFQSFAKSHLQYFRRKFEMPRNTHYMLMGNLANFFLDEIMYAEDIDTLEFNDVFKKSFSQMPFEYASCEDINDVVMFRDFMSRAKKHFFNIKRVVSQDMLGSGFDRSQCILEPSFFSEKYGFQGRLDLLQMGEKESRIIELKSGKAPYPSHDPKRIALNHEVQTVVYRMMIQSVFNKDPRQVYPTILYSSVDNQGENLRWSASYQRLEKDILNTRNLIVANEHDLYTGDEQTVETIFRDVFDIGNYEGNVPQFFVDQLSELKKILVNASDLEQAYVYRYINFISRELYLQKMGDEGYSTAMSQSALWNTTFEERKESLELVANLQIEEIVEDDHDMIIHFEREDVDSSSNFREGEICILYPRDSVDDTILSNQILKGTIVGISSKKLTLRFRYKQRNRTFFSQYKYWTVEHDKLDHGYTSMFKSLFAFLSASVAEKELLLGLKEPQTSYHAQTKKELNIDEKREQVLKKALSAEDYFLIVGPPGTGKTSVFARQLIERLYAQENTNILVLAYTNRAVDELCSAICSAFGEEEGACDKFIRIGSSLSCDEVYKPRLLQEIAYGVKSRKELSDKIASTRIFVGTLASIVGKPELFSLKKFHTAIIDEASQILEPQIIGLLPAFDRFIMIGDHKQLSTITLQNTEHSRVNNTSLNEIGLYNCRNSLFERLFQTCQDKAWTHAFDTLTYHGRMHKDIAGFVNQNFYDSCLQEIQDRQTTELSFDKFDTSDYCQNIIANNRLAFFPIRKSKIEVSDKVNKDEADMVVSLATSLIDLYKSNNKLFEASKTLGIITPYRNQIALIKDKLAETGEPLLQQIMVDTVERYQGSQRDVILLSFCMNKPYQLSFFSNMNEDGTVDRKLNVALSRAREQLFLIGNDFILSQNPIYRKLLDDVPIFRTK